MCWFFAAYAGYTQLAPVKGQWDITLKATKTADKAAFEPLDCAEDKVSAACNKPLLTADAKDKLQVTAALKESPLKTIDDLTPKRVIIKACYTKPSTADRPWRKSNDVIDVSAIAAAAAPPTAAALCTKHAALMPTIQLIPAQISYCCNSIAKPAAQQQPLRHAYLSLSARVTHQHTPACCCCCCCCCCRPQKDKSCPFVIKSAELNASSYTVEWPIPKNMTRAAWYATVLVQCENGTVNSYCQVSLAAAAAAALQCVFSWPVCVYAFLLVGVEVAAVCRSGIAVLSTLQQQVVPRMMRGHLIELVFQCVAVSLTPSTPCCRCCCCCCSLTTP
jgi:hypothetical protein